MNFHRTSCSFLVGLLASLGASTQAASYTSLSEVNAAFPIPKRFGQQIYKAKSAQELTQFRTLLEGRSKALATVRSKDRMVALARVQADNQLDMIKLKLKTLVKPTAEPAATSKDKGTRVAWKDTPTHRVKIKYVDGKEVGRWQFPRQKPAAPNKAASAAVGGKTALPWSSHRTLSEAIRAATAAKKDLVVVALFASPQSIAVARLLNDPQVRAAAGDKLFHAIDIVTAIKQGPDAVNQQFRDLMFLGLIPSEHPVVAHTRPDGLIYSTALPTYGSWFGAKTRVTPKDVKDAVSGADVTKHRARLETLVTTLEKSYPNDGSRYQAWHKVLRKTSERALRHPYLGAKLKALVNYAAKNVDVTCQPSFGRPCWEKYALPEWQNLGKQMQLQNQLLGTYGAFLGRDFKGADDLATKVALLAKKQTYIFVDSEGGSIAPGANSSLVVPKDSLETIRGAALHLQAQLRLTPGPYLDLAAGLRFLKMAKGATHAESVRRKALDKIIPQVEAKVGAQGR